jgi:hypothetical protein
MSPFKLSPSEVKTISVLALTLVPADTKIEKDFHAIRTLPLFIRYFQEIPQEIGRFFHILIHFLEWLPFLYGHFSRFSRLDDGVRLKLIEKWESGRLYFPRSIVLAMKSAVYMIYYSDNDVRQRIGIQYPCDFDPQTLKVNAENTGSGIVRSPKTGLVDSTQEGSHESQ